MNDVYPPDISESLPWIKKGMDDGTQPFIRDEKNQRWGISAEDMQENGFISGQTVSHEQLIFLLRNRLAKARTQLALAEAGCYPKGM